jgi:hypothetical protein
MLVLFDQGTPFPIRPFLKEHTVQTASERGWDTLQNGELLRAAEAAGFNVLVTPDKNIRYLSMANCYFAKPHGMQHCYIPSLCY